MALPPTRLTGLLGRARSGRAVWRWLRARGWLEDEALDDPGRVVIPVDIFWQGLPARNEAERQRFVSTPPPGVPAVPVLGGTSPLHELAWAVERYLTPEGAEALQAIELPRVRWAWADRWDAWTQTWAWAVGRWRPAPRGRARRPEREQIQSAMLRALARDRKVHPALPGPGEHRTIELPEATVEILGPRPPLERVSLRYDDGSAWLAHLDDAGQLSGPPIPLPLPHADP